MTPNHPLTDAARTVVNSLNRLLQEWEDAVGAANPEDGSQTALDVALAERYPFGRDLGEVAAASAEWADHVAEVMANPPGPLRAAAEDIRALAEEFTDEVLNDSDTEVTEPVKIYRNWQTGGLGGKTGDLGAVLGYGIAGPLADLLETVETTDDEDEIRQAADRVAAAIREGKAAIRK